MAAFYGYSWSSQYGTTDADDTWLHGLRGLSREQIGTGIRACLERSKSRRRASEKDFPPTLGEFRAMCEEPRVSQSEYDRKAYREFPRGLPRPPAKPETIERNLKRMKEKLGC